MKTSLVDAHSFVVVDIGSVSTRALLFDVVDNQYHFIAASAAHSTQVAPWNDINHGVIEALLKLQEVTGRILLDENNSLALSNLSNPGGVDQLAITYSAGPELHIVTTGLLGDVSLNSANRLASSTYGQIFESIGITDRRKAQTQIDAILRAEPDLVILAGGTDQGATRSVLRTAELVALACQVLPRGRRPEIIYAGNQALAKKIKEGMEKLTVVHTAPNIRPTVDQEELGPAQELLAQITTQRRLRQLGGFQQLSALTNLSPVPSAQGLGRMIRFLSQTNDPSKAVLGVDLGASYTTIASAQRGLLNLSVLPIGMGGGMANALKHIRLDDIMQWLPMVISPEEVRDYLYQKALYPTSLPATVEALAIEQAAARALLRLGSLRRAPSSRFYEPILAGGATIANAPHPAQALLMLLDGLQPVGVTVLELDQYGLLPALGAIAQTNALLPIQVLESSAFINLGTVISPICDARYGTAILAAQIEYEDGTESRMEIKQGALVSLAVYSGQTARIHLKPLRGVELDPRWENGGGFKVVGGLCGVVIDARGRPLELPADAARRRDMLKRWSGILGN